MHVSSRTGGAALAALGLVLAAVHLRAAAALWGSPVLVAVNGLLPLVLSAGVVAAGVQLARSATVTAEFVPQTLAWVVVGVAVLIAATTWLFANVIAQGALPPNAEATLANAATLGSLTGYLVGVSDARRRQQQADLDQLNRINDTLRVATREVVDADSREDLERRVCERLQQSNPYESAWIGRHDPGSDELRPAVWAGLEDEYYESVVVSLNEDDPRGRGPGGRAVRTGEIQCSQNVFADPSMEPWWDLFEAHGVESVADIPITDGGTVYGILSVYADRADVFSEAEREVLAELGESIGHAITAIEAREQLRRRERELAGQNERLDEFVSVLSHDLRSPLNVAEGSVELARSQRDGDALQRASRALARMNELVEDVLALARTGKLVSEFEPVDLTAVAGDAWRTTETSSATLDASAALGTVAGDESRVRELFENLFRNAIEHAGDGVTVTVGSLDDGFYVEDDGPGIPEADREAVFDTGFTTTPDGTGFGLNIVESIADAHGWTVSVRESEAGGARFEFTGVDREVADAAGGPTAVGDRDEARDELAWREVGGVRE